MYIKLSRKINLKDPHALDLKDADGATFHGNYRGCRSASCVKRYLIGIITSGVCTSVMAHNISF